jgi:hypothetical protein
MSSAIPISASLKNLKLNIPVITMFKTQRHLYVPPALTCKSTPLTRSVYNYFANFDFKTNCDYTLYSIKILLLLMEVSVPVTVAARSKA